MSTILITGGTGFVGTHLLESLATSTQDDIHLTSLDDSLQAKSIFAECKIHQIDLTDYQAVEALIDQINPDQIYHLASLAAVGASFDKVSRILHNNIDLTVNLFQAVRTKAPKARILSVGSAEEYGLIDSNSLPVNEDQPLRPLNPYAVSKASQTLFGQMYQRTYHLDVVFTRSFNHTGERQTADFVVPAFAAQIVAVERGLLSTVQVGNLDTQRDISDVKDVVRAYELIMSKAKTGQVINVGGGKPVKVQHLLTQLIDLSDKEIAYKKDQARQRPSDSPVIYADNTKLTELGWQPKYDLSQTLSRVLEWWREMSDETLLKAIVKN